MNLRAAVKDRTGMNRHSPGLFGIPLPYPTTSCGRIGHIRSPHNAMVGMRGEWFPHFLEALAVSLS